MESELDDYCFCTDSPKYYIVQFKKETYVILDLSGATNKSKLEKLLNKYVGEELSRAKKDKDICNPYNALDRFIRDIERKYDLIVMKNPVQIRLNNNLENEISKYNKRIKRYIFNVWERESV